MSISLGINIDTASHLKMATFYFYSISHLSKDSRSGAFLKKPRKNLYTDTIFGKTLTRTRQQSKAFYGHANAELSSADSPRTFGAFILAKDFARILFF